MRFFFCGDYQGFEGETVNCLFHVQLRVKFSIAWFFVMSLVVFSRFHLFLFAYGLKFDRLFHSFVCFFVVVTLVHFPVVVEHVL